MPEDYVTTQNTQKITDGDNFAPTRKPRGRPPIAGEAMTTAERSAVARRRQKRRYSEAYHHIVAARNEIPERNKKAHAHLAAALNTLDKLI